MADLFIMFQFINNENLFNSYLERKNYKVLAFSIVHFPNFELRASLKLVPPFIKRRT